MWRETQKTNVVMRSWKMKVSEHRTIGRPKCYKKRHEGERRRSTTTANVEFENLMRRSEIGKRLKKTFLYPQ